MLSSVNNRRASKCMHAGSNTGKFVAGVTFSK